MRAARVPEATHVKHARTHARTHMQVRTHAHARTHARTRTHTHTRTRSHTSTPLLDVSYREVCQRQQTASNIINTKGAARGVGQTEMLDGASLARTSLITTDHPIHHHPPPPQYSSLLLPTTDGEVAAQVVQKLLPCRPAAAARQASWDHDLSTEGECPATGTKNKPARCNRPSKINPQVHT